ncbi:MAG: flagellar motor protein MotD [Methylococcaceae bacterium]|nr:flagellar motor protein MotD [Methylococcaceae bacterium]
MTRRRRKIHTEADNHDRWMVSYADFITLLFAFFVVMYSMSSVNEGKYKRLTDSLGDAFSKEGHQQVGQPDNAAEPNPEQSQQVIPEPIPIGKPPTDIQPIPLENPLEVEKQRQLSEEILRERQQLVEVSEQFEHELQPFIEEKLVGVKKNDYWIELEMNSELLFLSGESALSKRAIPVLKKVAGVIHALPNAINVEGHTDDMPIGNIKFRSNWDLSSARATSVVHEFVKEGITPTRLSAIGYGEFHPIGDNKTEEGRFKNRRVVLVLMSQAFSRYGANDEERAKLLNLVPTEVSHLQKKL